MRLETSRSEVAIEDVDHLGVLDLVGVRVRVRVRVPNPNPNPDPNLRRAEADNLQPGQPARARDGHVRLAHLEAAAQVDDHPVERLALPLVDG